MSRRPPRAALFAGLLLTIPALASAADWVRVTAPGMDNHFYDRSKVAIRNDEVTYWRKVVFAKPARVRSGVARSAVYQETIHCRDHRIRMLSWQLAGEDGAAFDSAATPETEAAAIVPETIGDRFQRAMCDIVEAKQRHDADIVRDETLLSAKRKELEALKEEIGRLEAALARRRLGDPVPAAPAEPAAQ